MVQYDVKRVSRGTENFMVSFDFTKTPITQVADYIIIAASKNKASDIHFDPREDGMMVRFRIDGDCQDYTFIPKAYEKNLATRLKLLSNMNITETRLPQDGAIKGQFGDVYLDMRVSCLPTNEGEKIVIRILDYSRSLHGVESLGFHPKNLEKIKRMMGVPNGIILVTGATGSGKSTTTYSMLSELNRTETNIITVEDPVEMNIEGINQVQVNADIGMTFAAALRSILRQDPNVILIGEIRDSETAQIAVRASITGHLVMSTLHTNNALSTIERLLDMEVERYLLSSALTGIISQRLAKMLCPDCRYQRELTQYEKKVFKNFLHQEVPMIWDANPKGCENCRKGYRGRIALHEVLELDDHIRNALNNDKLEKEDLIKMVYTGKTITMLQDALIKVLEGQTSFGEVYRAIEIENEDEDNYEAEISDIVGNIQEEEPPVETTTDEMFDEDAPTAVTSTPLTQAIDIPGITTSEQSEQQITQTEQPVQPQVNPHQESIVEQPVVDDTTQLIPGVQIVPPQETPQEQPDESNNQEIQNEQQTIPAEEQSIDPGYKIVMPDENPTPHEEDVLDKQPEEITQPEQQQEPPHEPVQENYTINSIQGGLDEEKTDTIVTNKPEFELPTPIIDEDDNSATQAIPVQEEVDEKKYDASLYSDEEPIKPEIEIRTDFDNLISPSTPLEKLDLAKEEETHVEDRLDTQPEIPQYEPVTIIEPTEEVPAPSIQAISVIPSASQEAQELHTASEILTDPGIRIAQTDIPNIQTDGTISKPAEINAEPILPNIE